MLNRYDVRVAARRFFRRRSTWGVTANKKAALLGELPQIPHSNPPRVFPHKRGALLPEQPGACYIYGMNTRFKIDHILDGTITVSASGVMTSSTRAFVSADLLREFNKHGIKPGDLTAVIEALEEAEAEEEDMVSAWPRDTGLDNAIKIIPGNPRHGPRIKVAITPPDRFVDGGVTATIPFSETTIDDPIPQGIVPARVKQQLRDFIDLNRALLLAIDRHPDEGGISGVSLGTVLRKIG
jgi:hypothetical protein